MRKEYSLLLKKYRTIKRRQLKAGIADIDKENLELFRVWVWDKALDADFVKKQARSNLIQKENLEKAYEAVATETPSEFEILSYLRNKGETA